eukprot:CAMPEP_0113458280 /NCGR_PEP_ID=MMETSP0014_2-20120614/9843_1 /TAXON_ID=2857 /ORGANISM="Nitzschia sp." /LENGTH=451 /DNA_ID=CAMNT_0000349803 /DNA_START=235 /DNA_END=1590 /DNA_ORIENTATION=- /assembly_acc=CAM_ASM_000159
MVPAVSTTGNSPTPSSPAWANNYDNNTLSPVPVTAVQSQKQQQQHSPPTAFVVSSTPNPVPHQYHPQAAGGAAAVVSPSNTSDGRYYHSPALSPGDWNVASPNSYMSDPQQQLQQRQRYYANNNNNPGASPSAVLSPNTAPPGQVYHYQQQPQHSSSSPSTQSTWSMSSSSASSPSSINNTSSPDMKNQHSMMLRHQRQQVATSPSGNAVPPALPTNLGEQQQQPPSGQQEGQKESPEARGRVSSADVQKIQKSFMVKTSLDTGREQVASRRALDLIDVVAGKASNRSLSSSGGIKQKRSFDFQHPNSRSSTSKRMSARGMSAYQRSSRAAATANSSAKAAVVAADVMKELGSAAPAAGAPRRRTSAPQVVVSSDGSSIARGKPSLGKLTSMATSTWSKKKNETDKEEVTYRETVHDYKTSHDRDRETWAKNKALEMLRPDRHPFNIPGAA